MNELDSKAVCPLTAALGIKDKANEHWTNLVAY